MPFLKIHVRVVLVSALVHITYNIFFIYILSTLCRICCNCLTLCVQCSMFPVTWQCLRCCVETRDLRYVIIFRSKKINTDGVLSLNVLTARRLHDNKLKLKTVQSTGKCWQWLIHREYCIIYTINESMCSFLSVRCFCFVLEQTCRPFVYCIEMALKHLLCLISSRIFVHMDR